MKGDALGSKYFELAGKTLHTVVPSRSGWSVSRQRKVMPPQSWIGSSRCLLYQFRRLSGFFALKKMPPRPVTRGMGPPDGEGAYGLPAHVAPAWGAAQAWGDDESKARDVAAPELWSSGPEQAVLSCGP